jgi:DNA-binding NarL/FixJ family response regulator
MSPQRLKVILADDHPMMLEGLKKLLEPRLEVVAVVTDGHALLEAAERLRPDLVITDIFMPGIDGLAATRQLRTALPGIRVLILSIHTEHSWVREAFEAGAAGYLTKTSAPQEIELAIGEILKGQLFVSSAVTRGVIAAALKGFTAPLLRKRRAAGENLTPRELDILRLVGQGLGNKAIALKLGVSVTTVRTHLHRLYEKLRTASRLELALIAQAGGAVM